MPVAHFCSRCGEFSQQDGVFLWAVPCPHCGHVEKCRPHTPGSAARHAAREAYAAEQADQPVEAVGTIVVTSSAPSRRRPSIKKR